MMKKEYRKKVIVIVITVLLIVIYLIYSRPMTVSQLYPMLTLDKCTQIRGYYHDGTQVALSEFAIEKNSEEYQKLCGLLFEHEYRRSIRDIFPRGTRTHRSEPGDFQWEIYFYFEDIRFPDGSGGSGAMLKFQSWYGELDIHFDGERYSCYTSNQEEWAKEILDMIR